MAVLDVEKKGVDFPRWFRYGPRKAQTGGNTMNVSPASKSLDAQINDYLLNASGHLRESKSYVDGRQVAAFGAAASSALVMMSQAEAAVVHTTPGAPLHVLPTPAWASSTTGATATAPINLDGDANVDFRLYGFGGSVWSDGLSSYYPSAGLKPNGVNRMIGGTSYGYGTLRKLASGANIGPGGSWTSRSYAAAFFSTYPNNKHGVDGWNGTNGEIGFAGVEFRIGANTHYGWIRLQLGSAPGEISALDWAYEDCPNTPIAAGATSGGATCGVVPVAPKSIPVMGPLAYGLTSLALGGLGLGSLRRRRKARNDEAARH
jgi:hypothetical protein